MSKVIVRICPSVLFQEPQLHFKNIWNSSEMVFLFVFYQNTPDSTDVDLNCPVTEQRWSYYPSQSYPTQIFFYEKYVTYFS